MESKTGVALLASAALFAGNTAPAAADEALNIQANACYEAALSKEDSSVNVNFAENSFRHVEVEEKRSDFIAQCIKDGRIRFTASTHAVMENSAGDIVKNSKATDITDGSATVRLTRRYTCERKLNDNRVRRFGASLTRKVEQVQGDEAGRKDSFTYRFIVPKRINGQLNGC